MKGISPIIATVLLLAFTLTVAMIGGPFFTDVLTNAQEGQSEQAGRLHEGSQIEIDHKRSIYGEETGQYNTSFVNTGSEDFKNFTLTVFGEGDNVTQKRFNRRVASKELINVGFKTGFKPESVSIAAENVPAREEVDFGGEDSNSNLEVGNPPSKPGDLQFAS